MVVKYRLDELLKSRGMSARQLSLATGIATSTLSAIRRNEAERLDRTTIERICKALQCTPGDLIVYIPDNTLPPIQP